MRLQRFFFKCLELCCCNIASCFKKKAVQFSLVIVLFCCGISTPKYIQYSEYKEIIVSTHDTDKLVKCVLNELCYSMCDGQNEAVRVV